MRTVEQVWSPTLRIIVADIRFRLKFRHVLFSIFFLYFIVINSLEAFAVLYLSLNQNFQRLHDDGIYQIRRMLPLTPRDVARAAWFNDIPLFLGIYICFHAVISYAALHATGQVTSLAILEKCMEMAAGSLGLVVARAGMLAFVYDDNPPPESIHLKENLGCAAVLFRQLLFPPIAVHFAIAGYGIAWALLAAAALYFGIRSFRLVSTVTNCEVYSFRDEPDEESEPEGNLSEETSGRNTGKRPYELFALHPSARTIVHHLRLGFLLSLGCSVMFVAMFLWLNFSGVYFFVVFLPAMSGIVLGFAIFETNHPLRPLRMLPVTPRQCVFMITHPVALFFLAAFPAMLALNYFFPWRNPFLVVAAQAPLLFATLLLYYLRARVLGWFAALYLAGCASLIVYAGYRVVSPTVESLAISALVAFLGALLVMVGHAAPRGVSRNGMAYKMKEEHE